MKGAKSTTSDLEAELKKVLAENTVTYFWYSICNTFCLVGIQALRHYDLILDGIALVGTYPAALGHLFFGITLVLNLSVLSEMNHGKLDLVLRRFRWKIMAAVLMLQPRAYGLMKELSEHVEAEAEEEEDSAV